MSHDECGQKRRALYHGVPGVRRASTRASTRAGRHRGGPGHHGVWVDGPSDVPAVEDALVAVGLQRAARTAARRLDPVLPGARGDRRLVPGPAGVVDRETAAVRLG